jgi:hypothetical protein
MISLSTSLERPEDKGFALSILCHLVQHEQCRLEVEPPSLSLFLNISLDSFADKKASSFLDLFTSMRQCFAPISRLHSLLLLLAQ